MKRYKVILMTLAAAFSLGLSSCVGDLDVEPIDPNIQLPKDVLKDMAAYEAFLAKCYQGLAVSSSDGPSGGPDISGVDGGYGQYMRALYQLQEYTTDEAAVCWNDGTVYDLHNLCWTPANEFVMAMYARIFYQIGLCNEFLRQVSANPANLTEEQFPSSVRKQYCDEARALRALSYYHAIDLYGNVPFATENDSVGSDGPSQISRAALYAWLEGELKYLISDESSLAKAGTSEYGHADKGLAMMLLAKLYLNAEVYTGTAQWKACADMCEELDKHYSLHTTPNGSHFSAYQELFCADNDQLVRGGNREIIFVIEQHSENIQAYGATNFIIFASTGGEMNAAEVGISSGWGGISCPSQTTSLFTDGDKRNLFYKGYGQDLKVLTNFDVENSGYKSTKFTNLDSNGNQAGDGGFVDTDFPLFRLADAYLMYAECVARDASAGSAAKSLEYMNAVRERAGVSKYNTASEYSLREILNERARELFFECHRRSDLVRYGLFTSGSYVWDWKGGIYEGRGVDSHYNIFPIPSDDKNSNDKISQNPGY